MIIKNIKTHKAWAFVLALFINSYNGFCQTFSIIDLDKAKAIELPEMQKEDPIPSGMSRFNDILKVKDKIKTSYVLDFIPSYQPPVVSKGKIFIKIDGKESFYSLETASEITNINKPNEYQYKVFKTHKKEHVQSLLGSSYEILTYVVSIDQLTGDTLWTRQADYVQVRSAKQVSLIGNFIVDNKTGKELYKLNSSEPISIMEIKEDNGYLYLRKSEELIAIDLQRGEAIWRVKGDFNGFYIDETNIYTSNQCAIDKLTGKLIWNNSSEIWIVGVVGDYLVGYLYQGEHDPEVYVYNKNTGKLEGYLWSDNEFCTSCLGYESCNPEFVFAEEGEGNKTVALIKCNDGVYLYSFEIE